MSEKKINIKLQSKTDVSGFAVFEKQMNKMAAQLRNNPITKMAKSITPIGQAIGFVSQSISAAVSVIKDLNTSALNQIKAEKQLEAAAKNNPYLNKSNVSQLKEFAGQLQKVGTIGDEELLPMMSRLAAAGRTQTEIQDIMSAALDLSASGAMDMNSAVNALNGTLNGNAGTLGEQISGIKDLTQEELKSGKAIELVAKQYKGMASESAKAAGAGQQFKNAWGDLKEQLGMGFAKASAPVLRFFTSIVEKVTDFTGGVNKLMGLENKTVDIKPSDALKTQIENLKKEIEELQDTENNIKPIKTSPNDKELLRLKEQQKEAENSIAISEQFYNKTLEEQNKIISEAAANISILTEKKKALQVESLHGENRRKEIKDIEKQIKSEEKKQKKAAGTIEIEKELYETEKEIVTQHLNLAKAQAAFIDNSEALSEIKSEITEKQKELVDLENQYKNALEEEGEAAQANSAEQKYIDENYKAREAEIAQIRRSCEAKRQAGEEVSALEEQQQIYNAYLQSYIKLVTEANGLDIESTGIIEKRLAALKRESDKLSEITAQSANDEHFKKLVEQFSVTEVKDQLIELKDSLADLQKLQGDTDLMASLGLDPEKVNEAVTQCQESIDSLNFQKTLESAQNVGNAIIDALSVVSSAVDSITERELESIKSETEQKQDLLEKLYDSGAMSYEEYVLTKEKLDRQAADKEYELNLAKWTMDLAMGQAQAAMAVITNLAAAPMPWGAINAGIAGAAATVQLATMLANKPVRGYANGGIIGGISGATAGADNAIATVRTGEMVLNAQQQKRLLTIVDGNSKHGTGQTVVNMPVSIENTVSDTVTASVTQTENGLKVFIRKLVSEDMANGTYNKSLKLANQSMSGTRYV